MRIFSFLNVLLLLVVMATHEGAHLDNLLSPSQARWLNAGAKVMLTGQIDTSDIKMITKSAREHVAEAMPEMAEPAGQPFDFAAESRGGGNIGAAIAVPANFSMPASTADLDHVVTTVLASLQDS